MVSIRYFCGVGEFCRMKSSPRGALVSNNDSGTAAMPKAMQQTRSGIQAMRRMTMVTWEPSQLAYRAEPVIAHRGGSESHAANGVNRGPRRGKPYECWAKRTQCHSGRVTGNRWIYL